MFVQSICLSFQDVLASSIKYVSGTRRVCSLSTSAPYTCSVLLTIFFTTAIAPIFILQKNLFLLV